MANKKYPEIVERIWLNMRKKGFSYKEIAEITGCNKQTINRRLKRREYLKNRT